MREDSQSEAGRGKEALGGGGGHLSGQLSPLCPVDWTTFGRVAGSGMFSYNSSNVHQHTAAAAAVAAAGLYHVPASGFHLHHQYSIQNGQLPSPTPTAFTNVIPSRGYQHQNGSVQQRSDLNLYQAHQLEVGKANEEETRSMESPSESRSPTQSDQQLQGPLQTRKRRRGVIEKRRRDRINNSLLELRRLVPNAFEKQGSQKLEKAEILQMTVDHLKLLSSKGIDSLWLDQQRYATEYYTMGFRFCMNEVDSFLSKEGMDAQDSIRLRLVSHLQTIGLQRPGAFNVWATPHARPQPHTGQYQVPHWPSMNTASSPATSTSGFQYAPYGTIMLPPNSDAIPYSSPMAQSNGQIHQETFKNGFITTAPAQPASGSYDDGNTTFSAAVSLSVNSTSSGCNY